MSPIVACAQLCCINKCEMSFVRFFGVLSQAVLWASSLHAPGFILLNFYRFHVEYCLPLVSRRMTGSLHHQCITQINPSPD